VPFQPIDIQAEKHDQSLGERMLIGYVSDERYVAVSGVAVEVERDGQSIAVVYSTPRGAIYADIAPGPCKVTLAKDGFGSKSVELTADAATPYQFRLLTDGLLGYMWPKWVKTGERSEFRVHAVEAYQLTLWRYGKEKEFVRMLGWFDEHGPKATMQITPDGDYTRTGVEWNKRGYGSPHHTQTVVGPERSGLYYLHAKTESGAFFSFPWVVAPAKPSAKIVVVHSTNTWNAYNNFGGRSNYVNATELPPTPVVNARLDLLRYTNIDAFNEWSFPDEAYGPVSFERPEPCNLVPEDTEVTDPIRGRTGNHLAPAEWRMLGWLEREGYAYDVYSEQQLHDGKIDLDSYGVLVICAHPEYWSREMYQQVKDWVYDRGGHFMYLGGNGMNCEVEFLDNDALHFRNYLKTEGGKLGMYDPSDPTRYLESRFHRTYESEANLTGLVTTETGIMTAAPYKTLNADHWVFEGTGLKNGDIFGEESLHERVHGGASGHETDKMSASTPKNAVLLAKGTNIDEGGAEIVTFDTPSGGGVFSVGSITWPASILVSDAVSQITKNVIDRFVGD